jgi:Holliday junction resolvase RusA-like endonuclease
MGWDFDEIILGEPASAKNRRQIVTHGGKPRLIKSRKALEYTKTFNQQCPALNPLLDGDVCVRVDVWYASRRPDLACMDIIMDLLQAKVYANDRQVKATMSLWNLDREKPRVRIRVRSMDSRSSTGVSSFSASQIWGVET